jgi:hypothetical protein
LDGAVAESRQLPRHTSGVASLELRSFLHARGLDEDTWAPVLVRLGARRPSHLLSVRREHLEGESIPPLQREAFFRAVGGIDETGRPAAASSEHTAVAVLPPADPETPVPAPVTEPTTLIGFVNFWLTKLYADRPVLAIFLIVLIIGAIVAGVVTGSLAASDVVGGGDS